MVAGDRAQEVQDKAEAQPVPLMLQYLVAEDSFLTPAVQRDHPTQQVLTADDGALPVHEEVQHAHPTQQVLVAEDGALAVPDGVQNINPTQQILVAEDLTAEAAQHDHPTQRDLVPEDLAAEEVHLVPHYNKHGKGVTKETVEDAVFETTVVGIGTTDKHEPIKDWAARHQYRETTLKTTTRQAPARRRTPLSSPLTDADEVEETPAEGREGNRDAYVEEFHKTEGVHWEVAVRHDVDPGGVREDAHAGECDGPAQKRLFEEATGDKEHDDNVEKTQAKDCEDYTQARLFGDVQEVKEYGDGSTSHRPKLLRRVSRVDHLSKEVRGMRPLL
jgi:hypothetical protein